MYCDNCGKEHADTAMFCDECGRDLSEVDPGHGGGTQPTQGSQGGHQQGGNQYNQSTPQQGGGPQQGGHGDSHQQGGGGYQQGGGGYQQGGGQQQGGGGYQQGGGGYQQGGGQYGGEGYGGAPQDAGEGLTVRSEADKYLKKFSTYNLVLGCLTALFGLLFLVVALFAGSMMTQLQAAPVAASGFFGAAMIFIAVLVLVFSGLYFATWHFAKKRSAVAVYGMTGLLALGTVLNAISLNIIGFPITLLGAYWGYKSFDAV